MRAVAAALLALACTGGASAPEVGQVRVCLGADAPPGTPAVLAGGVERWDLAGTVVDLGPFDAPPPYTPAPCVRDRGRAFTVEDAVGVRWRVGLAVLEDLDEKTPELPVAVGDEVEVTFLRADVQDEEDQGVAVRDADGLLLAAERGLGRAHLPDLAADRMDGVQVERGEGYTAFFSMDCGIGHPTDLLVTGDGGPVRVPPWTPTRVVVAGQALSALNPGAWSFVGASTCAEVPVALPWVLSR